MQFSINRDDFAVMLGRVVPIIPKNPTSPLLGCLVVSVGSEGSIRLLGNSTEAQVEVSISSLDVIPGETAINAHMLAAIFRKLPKSDKPVTVKLDGDSAVIQSGRSRFKIPVLDAADYPRLSKPETAVADFSVNCSTMTAVLSSAGAAMPKESTRWYLYGVSVRTNAGKLVFASTDGHRLLKRDSDIAVSAELDMIISRPAVEYLVGNLGTDGNVDVSIADNIIRFEKGDLVYTARLIDGTFPDYDRLIPSGGEIIYSGDREALLDALDVISPVSEIKSHQVSMSSTDGESVKLTTNDNAASEGVTEIDAEAPFLSGAYVNLNGDYLTSVLKAMPGDHVEMFSDPKNINTAPIRISDPDYPGLVGIVMPMRG